MNQTESSSSADKPAAPPTFDAIPLGPDVRKAIDTLGYKNPTPVQLAVYEPATRGKNLVVQARTGTGKTAAFGLPLVDKLVQRSINKVQALVLTPTRELALQVARELEKLAQFKQLHAIAIYGGAPMGKQIEELEAGAQIVVGTPGRVLDHLRRGTFDPSNVKIFVLDEADEMLSMGFAKELHAIVSLLPKERQGLFFSATIPSDIERMAIAQLKDPEFVTLSSDQVGALQIQHFAYIVPGGDKRDALVKVVEVENPESAVVFCNTNDETERVSAALQNAGYDAEWLNGDLEQKERERIMARTREGKLRFLVATDVAARGIDISHLTHVINFDMPEAAESYVHRTGRTGRAGRTGTAIAMVGPKDIGNLYMLRLTYGIRPIERQLPSAGELKTRAEMDLVGFFVDAFGSRQVHPDDLALARRILTHADAETIVAALVRDHLGARAESEGDPKTRAAEARRAKNPPADIPANASPSGPQSSGRESGQEAWAVTFTSGSSAGPTTSASSTSSEGAQPPRDRGDRGDRGSRGPRGPRPERTGSERAGERSEASNLGPRRPERTRDRSRDVKDDRVPHKSYTSWEPPVETDDDQPLISRNAAEAAPPSQDMGRARRTSDTEYAPPLPGFTEDEPETQALPGRSGDANASAGGTNAGGSSGGGAGHDEEPGFAQIFVNVGRRDGVKPGDLQRLLTEGAGIERQDTGRIRIRDRNSFVSVRTESVTKAVAALSGQTLGGRSLVAEPARPRS